MKEDHFLKAKTIIMSPVWEERCVAHDPCTYGS